MAWGDDGPECERCHEPTRKCDVCGGDGKVQFTFGDCTECDGTGYVCERDGKHWRR